ncbi:hypothetical protein [Paenibacillus sp. HB172176]|uniref:hypothetical protein n=1 Tax=Paenibacillus sp. HB172176 TaxID=2493690 RepID=UPI001438F898|nr:hypothetical protein [Paenibacillus sp. HB172176]
MLQEMSILAEAMQLTGLQAASSESTINENLLDSFIDASSVSSWARSGVSDSVLAGIVTGRDGAG